MRAKTVNFQKGLDPKSALDIGVIRSITADDLSLLGFGWDYETQTFDIDKFKKEYRFGEDFEEELQEDAERAMSVAKALEGKIIMHDRFFDWKEENEFNDFIKSDSYPDYPFIYDSFPSLDGWRLVFSKIQLPNIDEEIHRSLAK